MPLSTLAKISDELKAARKNKKVVFTNGCFDILHVGHLRYLKDARQLGDILVIGLNSDRSVKELKGETRPVQTEGDRAELLLGLECVDYVVIFDDSTPKKLIEQVRPDFLVKGGDWAISQIVGSDFVQSYGGTVKSLPFHKGRSTSSIIDKIIKTT